MQRSSRSALALAMDGKGPHPFEILLKTARALWQEATVNGEEYPGIDTDKAKEAAYIAEKAAPYVHPKLSSIALDNGDGEPFVIRFDKEDKDA